MVVRAKAACRRVPKKIELSGGATAAAPEKDKYISVAACKSGCIDFHNFFCEPVSIESRIGRLDRLIEFLCSRVWLAEQNPVVADRSFSFTAP